MEEAKYYTPSIEEFYVGFEFEVKMGNIGDWNKVVFDELTLNSGFPDIHETYRVKFLDRQDIEAEGWKTEDKNAQTGEADGWIYCATTTTKDEYYMNFCPLTNIAIISDIDENLFVGTIRNISEFRKLLKQLGIK